VRDVDEDLAMLGVDDVLLALDVERLAAVS
jgi:hypothetical protein